MRVQGPEQHQAAADAPAGEDEQQHLLSMQAQEEGAGKTAAATTVCVWGGGGAVHASKCTVETCRSSLMLAPGTMALLPHAVRFSHSRAPHAHHMAAAAVCCRRRVAACRCRPR